MIEVIINGKNVTLDLSDETRDLIDDAVVSAINEIIASETGDADFDINSINHNGEFKGNLRIFYNSDDVPFNVPLV